jgi:uncharacterized membrane protein
MNNSRFLELLFYFVSVVCIILPFAYYGNLSEQVAAHFDSAGNPNEWMSRDLFVILHVVILLILILTFSLINIFISKIPDRMINLPQKEYWLHSSQRDYTIQMIKNFMLGFGVLTISFLSLVLWEIYKANLNGTNSIGSVVWIYLIIFLIVIFALVIKLYLNFYKSGIKSSDTK